MFEQTKAAAEARGLTYYDFCNDDALGELADHFAIHCHANCSPPTGWSDEVHLTDSSFDITKAPVARGLFVGDYVGLAANGSSFLRVFTQPHDGDPASDFFRRVGP